MKWSLSLFACLLTLLIGCPPPGGDGDSGPRPEGGFIEDTDDEDGDGIADVEEGRDEDLDTDGDGQEDYLDLDSDNDGIPDAVEAGDSDPATPAQDSDADGIPNFQDTDSDGNGIFDRQESMSDSDADGVLDYADPDDDNDFVPDSTELSQGGPGIDTDADGIVDFKDPDSDNDTISDGQERDLDTDLDELPDRHDVDSDNDGILDKDEAGDADLGTLPVDTDGDEIPDFRDPDSDNDGISDTDENAAGTSPTNTDSDMDGVSDLIEVGAGTDPLDATENPRTQGNFVFVVPWMEDPMPPRDTLSFKTSIQFADVYFLFDRSGSMAGEISAMRDAVNATLSDLTCADTGIACMDDDGCAMGTVCSLNSTCVEDPSVSTCVTSIWSGAGRYESSYNNVLSLQADSAATGTAIGTISTGGSDEDFFEAVTIIANGSTGNGCAMGGVGCPNYRPEAVKLLVAFTDENSDGGSRTAAAAAMNTAGIKFIGVWSGAAGSGAKGDMLNLARDTNSFRPDGTTPLVFEGMNAAVAPTITGAINEVVEGVPLRITIEATESEDADDGDALRFIEHLEVNVSGNDGCTNVMPTEDTDANTFDDAFSAVRPGTSVCWDVVSVRNDAVQEPAASPLVYKAKLTVFGDGSPVDSRDVIFLVPPKIEVNQGPI